MATAQRVLSDYEYSLAEPTERLMSLVGEWQQADNDPTKAFLRGRMFEITLGLNEHPDHYDMDCGCATCRSYG